MRHLLPLAALALLTLALPAASAHLAPCLADLPCSSEDCATEPPAPVALDLHLDDAGRICASVAVICITAEACEAIGRAAGLLGL